MANHSIDASQLTEGTSVLIRGKLAFARLTRLIQGQELADSDQRKVQNGLNPVGQPHTTATITGAEVQFADPDNPTPEEQFVSERRYASKKNPDTGANYSIDSKGTNLPVIAIPSEAGDGTYDQDTSGQELARDLDVTLVLRFYKPRNYNKRGVALDQVVVHETPRYYNAGGVGTNELAARGIVFNNPPQAVQASEATPVGDAPETPVDTEVSDGLSFPAPQPTAAAPDPDPTPAQEETETLEQKLERLEAENTSLKDAGSAVGAPTASESPWNGSDQAQQAGITYQG